MKPVIFIFIIVILILSCKKGGLGDCTKDQFKYEFTTSGQIDTIVNTSGVYYQVISGNNIVFSYTHIGPDCKNIADEEYTEYFAFQVSSTATSFNYQNSQFSDGLPFFKRVCFCPLMTNEVNSGNIKGTKISSSKWDIQIDIFLPNSSDKLVINKIFTLR